MLRMLSTLVTLTTSPALAIDACMVGTWEADGADMAHVLGAQMNGSANHVSGRTSLEIDPTGTMTLLAEEMTFSITVPDIPPMQVIITGYAQGAMNADDGRSYIANAPEYALVGSADVLGQRMDIPVTSAHGTGWGNSTGTYGCSATSMSFEATQMGSIPRRWRRIR